MPGAYVNVALLPLASRQPMAAGLLEPCERRHGGMKERVVVDTVEEQPVVAFSKEACSFDGGR